MRQVRIFQAGEYQPGQQIELSPQAAQHVALVLRMKVSEPLILFNGRQEKDYHASIVSADRKHVKVEIISVENTHRESPLKIELAQAISKGDRMDFAIQKAVELGVSSIQPLFSERCVVKLDEKRLTKKQQQWQAISVGACEQSGRCLVPEVKPAMQFSDYIKKIEGQGLILAPGAEVSLSSVACSQQPLSLLIGPEGGFSETEIKQAASESIQALSLGPRILRTETAALTALAVLQANGGDL